MASTSGSMPTTATRRRRSSRTRSSVHNRGRSDRLADGIVVTPSHNPPEDGGFKYNPPNGGPADTDVTRLDPGRGQPAARGRAGRRQAGAVRRGARGRDRRTTSSATYVGDLASVIDMDAIRASGLRLGVDPLGGASVAYWPAIADRYGLDLTVTNAAVDPQFAFMTCDWDGRIRMDSSSPYAMARLVELRDRFDVAFGNDADADRHGIVTPGAGLMNPNHFLAVAVGLPVRRRPRLGRRRGGRQDAGLERDDRPRRRRPRPPAARGAGRVQVVRAGLVDGSLGFGGEESAGASFLRRDGTVWTTDKDGIIACLLAAEMTARTGRDPGRPTRALTERFGAPAYRRIDAPATPAQKAVLGQALGRAGHRDGARRRAR